MTDTTQITSMTLQEYYDLTSALSFKDWLTIIALFLSAIVAVIIGQYLQDRKAKKDRIYQNKFLIFATILGNRHALGWNENFVLAINQIPIIFNDNAKVIAALDKFIQTHKTASGETQLGGQDLQEKLNDLIIAMAKELNYDQIDNNLISSYFRPDASFFRYKADELYNFDYVNSQTQNKQVVDKKK